jgi:hypothetical protein
MVTSVAYQLRSSALRNGDDDGPAPGDARRPAVATASERAVVRSERGLRAGDGPP